MASSNPFRQRGISQASAASPSTTSERSLSTSTSSSTPIKSSPSAVRESAPTIETIETILPVADHVPKKAGKKVRVQSPTPSSPSMPSSASTMGEFGDARSPKSADPPSAGVSHQDPFETASLHSEDGEQMGGFVKAPPNPFNKTLETMERVGKDTSARMSHTMGSPGRASMDVEAFKRLLMTGNAAVAASTSPGITYDGASSTDTSSISRQSIFDATQDVHSETPRTSHELSEREDEAHRFSIDQPSSRRGPPPPSSKHGKLIRVELRDDPALPSVSSPSLPGSSSSNRSFNRSLTDVNKPLPPAPRRSHDSGRESIFDMEAAGRTPEPPSPREVKPRWASFPVPPRRHSHIISESRQSQEPGQMSPKEETDTLRFADIEPDRSLSNSGRAPPLPPARRSNSVRAPARITSTSSHSGPLVPPSRSASNRSATRTVVHAATERHDSLNAPPPPPPRVRHSEDSYVSPTSSTVPSGDSMRRSTESNRKASSDATAIALGRVGSSLSSASRSGSGGGDILADLTNLQKEIDELRVREEKGSMLLRRVDDDVG